LNSALIPFLPIRVNPGEWMRRHKATKKQLTDVYA
jgi:hypothetical protein